MMPIRSFASRPSRVLCALALVGTAATAHAEHFYANWLQEYNLDSQQGQTAAAVTMDHRGNVITAGNAMSDSGFQQYYIAKYDGLDGHLVWQRFFGVTQGALGVGTPSGDSFARAVAVDSQDNVIVTGGASFTNTLEDFITIKYDANGGFTWVRSYNNTNQSGADEAKKVVIDKDDNVIVTGVSYGGNTADDIVTIKYTSAGAPVFSGGFRRYARTVGGINTGDVPTGLAVDKNGVIWVTGSSTLSGSPTFLTLEYSPTGTLDLALVPTSPAIVGTPHAVAVNSLGDAIVAGNAVDSFGNDGYYTTQYRHGDGAVLWTAKYSSGHSDHEGGAQGVGVDASNDVYVTGAVTGPDPNNTATVVTLKYAGDSLGTGTVKWTTVDTGFSPIGTTAPNKDLPVYDTLVHQLVVDGAGQVIIVGDTIRNIGQDEFSKAMYLAKYNGADGSKLYTSGYGGDFGGPDTGLAVAVDAAGNIAIAGTEKRDFNNIGIGHDGIATIRFQRIIAEPGDLLPPNPTTQAVRKISALNAPALADNGNLAARITLVDGKTKLAGLLTQGGAGGSLIPVIQKGPAPNVAGATFTSFSDPVVSPNGQYAFLAKLAGVPKTKVSSLWTNLGGTLHLALQQGADVPGVAGTTVSSIASIAMRDSQLVALLKVSGASTSNMLLIGLNAANTGKVLLRTGTPYMVMQNNVMKSITIKSLTVLSPTKTSPGDGRSKGDDFVLAKGVLTDKSTVILQVSTAGVITTPLFMGQDASEVVAGATWKTFSIPAVAPTGGANAVLGTMNLLAGANGVSTANDTAIVSAPTGNSYALVAREGFATPASANLANISFSALTDPVIDSNGNTAFLATLKATSSAVKVSATNNRALFFGAAGASKTIARTGSKAPDSTGNPGTSSFSSFTAIALPDATDGPIFVAKLSGGGATAKTNVGVWGKDSHGVVRQLLRTGDHLGSQVVSSITLLKATPQAFTAARSFNADGGVVMLLGFTDHTTGLVEIGIP